MYINIKDTLAMADVKVNGVGKNIYYYFIFLVTRHLRAWH